MKMRFIALSLTILVVACTHGRRAVIHSAQPPSTSSGAQPATPSVPPEDTPAAVPAQPPVASLEAAAATPLLEPSESHAALEPPRLLFPQEGALLTNFPRVLQLQWSPVAGATRYAFEIDCYDCCAPGTWCSESDPRHVLRHDASGTNGMYMHVGDNPGRWRVFGIDASGRDGTKSGWRQFTFNTGSTSRPQTLSVWTPAGDPVGGPDVTPPKATYSPHGMNPSSAAFDHVSGSVLLHATVDENGRVHNVQVVRSLRADFDDVAVEAFRRWQFEPARGNGQALQALISIEMSFLSGV